ncbi:MAG: acetolactate synthase small subunit [bacterium]|nr:acetolactate synthase small subunit [bacterium]
MKEKENYTDHTISLIVLNRPGVMSEISGLITRRGFNVESISAGKSIEKDTLRLTIVINGDDRSLEQIQKQLFKIVDCIKVTEIKPVNRVAREMVLVKIKLTKGDKNELFQLINIFKAKIVDTSAGGIIVEVTGPPQKIDGFINLLSKNLIVGIARTGIVALNKLID